MIWIVSSDQAVSLGRTDYMGYRDYIKYAESLASANQTDQQHQVVALLIKGGKVIEHGINNIRYVRGTSYFEKSLHAEIDLIRKCRDQIRGSKVFVYRFNNSTSKTARDPKCSIPCPMCQHELKTAGVAKVYCSDSEGNAVVIRKDDLMQMACSGNVITRLFLTRFNSGANDKFDPLTHVI